MKKYHVKLIDEQRLELQRLVNSGKESARKITRARILLKADEGKTDPQIADALDVSVRTAERVRQRFATGGDSDNAARAAIERRPQPLRPQKRKLDGEAEAKLVMLACSQPPEGHGHWTLDLLADRMVRLNYVPAPVSRDTIGRALKKTRSSRG